MVYVDLRIMGVMVEGAFIPGLDVENLHLIGRLCG